MADGLLPRTGFVDRFQRQGDFDEFSAMIHGAVPLISAPQTEWFQCIATLSICLTNEANKAKMTNEASYKPSDSNMLQNYGAVLWRKIYSRSHPLRHIIRLPPRAIVPRDVPQLAVLVLHGEARSAGASTAHATVLAEPVAARISGIRPLRSPGDDERVAPCSSPGPTRACACTPPPCQGAGRNAGRAAAALLSHGPGVR